ncbi:MAG: hypothetical protein ACXV79_03320, partial [Methylobacter sp.]
MRKQNQLKTKTLPLSSLHPNWLDVKPSLLGCHGLPSAENAGIFHHGKLTALALGLGLTLAGLVAQQADAAVSAGADSEWLQDGGGPQGIRYSELGNNAGEINAGNVANLKQKFILATYRNGSAMGSPLYVAQERMIYALTGSPNILMAW